MVESLFENRLFTSGDKSFSKPPLLNEAEVSTHRSIEEIISVKPLVLLEEVYDSADNSMIGKLIAEIHDKDVIFSDLDQTLAPSKYRISNDMAKQMKQLLEYKKLVIITGGLFETVIKNVVEILPSDTNFSNLVIAPIQGNEVFEYNDINNTYELLDIVEESVITSEEATEIHNALEKAIEESSISSDSQNLPFELDKFIQDRGTNSIKGISLACLGQTVPIEYKDYKENYDPDRKKRQEIIEIIKMHLSTELAVKLDFKIGGSTTIDIVKRGCDKGTGIKNYMKFEKNRDKNFDDRLSNACMLGDSFEEGGNDKPANDIGVQSIHVGNPEVCTNFISGLNNYHLSDNK